MDNHETIKPITMNTKNESKVRNDFTKDSILIKHNVCIVAGGELCIAFKANPDKIKAAMEEYNLLGQKRLIDIIMDKLDDMIDQQKEPEQEPEIWFDTLSMQWYINQQTLEDWLKSLIVK